MAELDVLTIGVPEFPHSETATWKEAASLFVPDYRFVIADFSSLPQANDLGVDELNQLVAQFRRVCQCGGKVALMLDDPFLSVVLQAGNKVGTGTQFYPVIANTFGIKFTAERGQFTEVAEGPWWPRYLSKLESWKFHFVREKHATTVLMTNREKSVLAAQCKDGLAIIPVVLGMKPVQRATLVLECLREQPIQPESPPPEWVSEIAVPGKQELDHSLAEKRQLIRATEADIDTLEVSRSKIMGYTKLLYETGAQLEQIVKAVFEKLGATVENKKYEDEDLILTWSGEEYIVEVKGIEGELGLRQVRQLLNWTMGAEEQTKKRHKGILVANYKRLSPPKSRRPASFPENTVENAERFGAALVSTVDLFDAFCDHLSGKRSASEILDRLVSGTGVVDLGNGNIS